MRPETARIDSRRQPRFKTDQEVKVTCLESEGLCLSARLANISDYGMGLVLSRELPPRSLIKVEWGSTLLLAEVLYCNPQGEEFIAGLEVEEAIYDTVELGSIVANWE